MTTKINQSNGFSNHLNGNVLSKSSLQEMEELAKHGKTLPPLKRLLGNYILENSAIIFAAERGSGKTLLGLQTCIAISAEWKSLWNEPIEYHGNTLFINCELSEDVISRRLSILFEQPPQEINFKNYRSYVYTTKNGLDEEAETIIEMSMNYKPVLIVLDNFRVAFLNSDTNNNKEVAKAMHLILTLRDMLNTTIIITDHTRKHTRHLLTESDLQSGSGVKSDLTDSDMFLRKSKQDVHYRILKRSKSRHCEESDGAKLLKLNTESLWFDFLEDNIDESRHIGNETIPVAKEDQIDLAKELKDQGKSLEEISKILNKGKTTIHRWLKE
jgi:predicted ATP-dependent serine protease